MSASGNVRRLAYGALAAVCIFWGTTYLSIRIGLETFSPASLIGLRYLISGSLLLLGAKFAGIRLPRGRELWLTVMCGVICIGIGNGFLALAELCIPSGWAALFYTMAPFWMVGIDAFLPHGKRPFGATIGGLLSGVLGVAFLIYPAVAREGFSGKTLTGFLFIQISAAGWTLGSLLQKRVPSAAPPFVSGGVQQVAAGVVCAALALGFEKPPAHVDTRALLAVAYLVVFGSIVGYSAFIYAVKHLPVAIVSIYYFVNPLVAVFLGWLFFREPFGYRAALAMAIIFVGIGIVRWSEAAGTTRLLAAGSGGSGEYLRAEERKPVL